MQAPLASQLAHKLTGMNHAAPFIVVSRAVEDVREGVLKAGATAVFGKHVGPDALIAAIRVARKTTAKFETHRLKGERRIGIDTWNSAAQLNDRVAQSLQSLIVAPVRFRSHEASSEGPTRTKCMRAG
jgi:DNA-binding NarL/FixJ family response regulator